MDNVSFSRYGSERFRQTWLHVASLVVEDTVESYLASVDAEAPGLIEGLLYLEGSLALNDFRPRASDIDFVAITAAPPDTTELSALERVHTRLRERQRRPFFDGIYLTWNDLAAGPQATSGRPTSHEGKLVNPDGGQHNPVTWHTLAHHGVTLRGPAAADLDIWTDPTALAAWQNTNLDEYWARGLTDAARLFSKFGLVLLTDYGTVWTVTGVARLHYTIATGDITSKDGAGRHALQSFPDRWHRIINEALRLRRNDSRRSLYRNPLTRRRDILAFGHMVIADAHRIFETQPKPPLTE
ncbi:aminoglycoside adenylyltransferase domain-containing protein [Nocardia sp. CA-128927]|uniref:aminoglycoside adenylyltransferase domain-containing protein n=1 Tax=Nocardia sp. CA-128927 TaxID=3239975 RepID=UPI003D95CAE5